MAGSQMVDVFIVGGGINGCGIARDAAGRGYSVFLAEMNDFASGTSSWSTKLVHGGLRYLEHYEFRLVREALMEREVLWGSAAPPPRRSPPFRAPRSDDAFRIAGSRCRSAAPRRHGCARAGAGRRGH